MLAQHLAWRRVSVSGGHASNLGSRARRLWSARRLKRRRATSVDRIAEDEASACLMTITDDRTVYRRRQLLEHLVMEPRELRANLGVLQRLEEIGAGEIALTRSSFGTHAPESTAKDERDLIRFRFRSK